MYLVDKYMHFIHMTLKKILIFDELHQIKNATVLKPRRIQKNNPT